MVCLPLAQGVVLESRDCVLHQAPLEEPTSLSASLSLSLSLSLNKIFFKNLNSSFISIVHGYYCSESSSNKSHFTKVETPLPCSASVLLPMHVKPTRNRNEGKLKSNSPSLCPLGLC